MTAFAQLDMSHRRHHERLEALTGAAERLAAGVGGMTDVEELLDTVMFFGRSTPRHFGDEDEVVFPALARAQPATAAELAALRGGALDPRGLARAIRRREAGVLWRLDGMGRRAALLLGAQLATGSPAGIGQALARTRALTVDAVVAAAERWLAPERMVEVVTRPGRGDVTLDAAARAPTVRA